MAKSFNSPEEQARLRAVKADVLRQRQEQADKANGEHRKAEAARDEKTARLRALRMSAENDVAIAAPEGKPARKSTAAAAAPNTRRSINS